MPQTDGTLIHIDSLTAHRLINKTEKAPVAGYEEDYIVGIDVFHQLYCLVGVLHRNLKPVSVDSHLSEL
jgi:hypothetical protein